MVEQKQSSPANPQQGQGNPPAAQLGYPPVHQGYPPALQGYVQTTVFNQTDKERVHSADGNVNPAFNPTEQATIIARQTEPSAYSATPGQGNPPVQLGYPPVRHRYPPALQAYVKQEHDYPPQQQSYTPPQEKGSTVIQANNQQKKYPPKPVVHTAVVNKTSKPKVYSARGNENPAFDPTEQASIQAKKTHQPLTYSAKHGQDNPPVILGYPPVRQGYPPALQSYVTPQQDIQPQQQDHRTTKGSLTVVYVNDQQEPVVEANIGNEPVKEEKSINHCLHFCISMFFFPWIFVWMIMCYKHGC